MLKKNAVITCTICKGKRHNKKTCKNVVRVQNKITTSNKVNNNNKESSNNAKGAGKVADRRIFNR